MFWATRSRPPPGILVPTQSVQKATNIIVPDGVLGQLVSFAHLFEASLNLVSGGQFWPPLDKHPESEFDLSSGGQSWPPLDKHPEREYDLFSALVPLGKYLRREFVLSCDLQRGRVSRYQHVASHFLTHRSRWHLDGSALRLLHRPPSLPRRPASVKIRQSRGRARESQIANAPRRRLRHCTTFSSPKWAARSPWS